MSVSVSADMHMKIRALAYLRGSGGSYAALVRNFVMNGLREATGEMNEREKADYEEILANLRMAEEIKKAPL